MTARPGRLKAEIAVPFGPKHDAALRTSPEFYRLHAEVYTRLTAERQASLEHAAAHHLSISRPRTSGSAPKRCE